MSRADHFLARWSRLKRNPPATVEAVPAAEQLEPAAGVAASQAARQAPDPARAAHLVEDSPRPPAAASAAVALPDPASLTLDSDFTAFLKAEVGDALRRQALKKLFSDPHFNVMDGLDIYIGDYSVSEPIPPELLAKLTSASEWLAGREDLQTATGGVAGAESVTPAAVADEPADAAPPSSPDASDAAAPSGSGPAADQDPARPRT